MGSIAGRAFNIGGGASNSVSVLEVLDHLERLLGRPPDLAFDQWRIGAGYNRAIAPGTDLVARVA